MGFYSSWAAFSLTHHVIVRACEISSGFFSVKPGSTYVVLGDDICISSQEVAKEYREFMRMLGVEISEAKSLVPNPSVPQQAEFCKRTILAGLEVSPLPLRLLKIKDGDLSLSLFLSV